MVGNRTSTMPPGEAKTYIDICSMHVGYHNNHMPAGTQTESEFVITCMVNLKDWILTGYMQKKKKQNQIWAVCVKPIDRTTTFTWI